MKNTLLLLPLLLMIGCTPLIVQKPVGSNYKPEELKRFEGTWLHTANDDPTVLHIKKVNDDGEFIAANLNWVDDDQKFEIEENRFILKHGNQFGILHISPQDREEDLYLITLFKVIDEKTIHYWATDKEKAQAFLDSGTLETKEIDGDQVITDTAENIIRALESNQSEIFDPEYVILTKITE